MSTATATVGKVVSQDQWLAARKELLAKEKELTRQRDELSRLRLELPWVRVDNTYVFEGPNGRRTLADLFEGRSQLLIYHFMFGPDWAEGCPSCSMVADNFDGVNIHLQNRDVTLAVVSRAPLPKIQAFQQRMGWKFNWVSSYGSNFNFDFQVSFTPEEVAKGEMSYNYGIRKFPKDEGPGMSAFYKDEAGTVYHTYSGYARGLESLLGVYDFLDIAPKGRNEEGLSFPMAWVRHHDKYENSAKTGCCASEAK